MIAATLRTDNQLARHCARWHPDVVQLATPPQLVRRAHDNEHRNPEFDVSTEIRDPETGKARTIHYINPHR